MGIKNLNRYLIDTCSSSSIAQISMSDLAGKKIAIDVSIYLYKFLGENTLIESMYSMLVMFRHYNITPIFIFDGKPPDEKRELITKRREEKMKCEKEYNRLKDSEKTTIEIQHTMDSLKKQFVYVRRSHIIEVKELIRSCGCTYYDAPQEADELCVLLVTKKKVWACLSEDMDMFVYGCTRVIRQISLLDHTAVLYHIPDILTDLQMNQQEFREVCVLSGTDYNTNYHNDKHNLFSTMRLFGKYSNSISKSKPKPKSTDGVNGCDWRRKGGGVSRSSPSVDGGGIGFYEWLCCDNEQQHHHHRHHLSKTMSINTDDCIALKNIISMFDLSFVYEKHGMRDIIDSMSIKNSAIDKTMLLCILEKNGFDYPQPHCI